MRMSGLAARFFSQLAGEDIIPAHRIAVVVAHPDDETIGLGAQLPRLSGVQIVHVTNGSPRNPADANRAGFATPAAYAAWRRHELKAAMALAGVPPAALTQFGITDQEAALHLVGITRRLAEFLVQHATAVVLTHAMEGGHPDHEAAAFAAREAASLMSRGELKRAPVIVEMPFYRAGEAGWITQQFLPLPDHPELTIWLGEAQRAFKARMYAAYGSQKEILNLFPMATERFRCAPHYDFSVPPHDGELLYERENWGMTRERWGELVKEAHAELRETRL